MARTNPLIVAVRRDNLSRLAALVSALPRRGCEPDPALALAAELDRPEAVSVLLPHASRQVCGRALGWAAAHDHVRCVRVLLSRSTGPSRGEALKSCAMHGCLESLEVLLRCTARRHCSSALSHAAEFGQEACVRRILPYADPNWRGSMALYWALLYGHARVQALLEPVSNVQACARRLLLVACSHVDWLAHALPEDLMRQAMRRLPGQVPRIAARLQGMELDRATAAAKGAPGRASRL